MKKHLLEISFLIILIPFLSAVAFPIIYGFAMLGEPQSIWLLELIGVTSQ